MKLRDLFENKKISDKDREWLMQHAGIMDNDLWGAHTKFSYDARTIIDDINAGEQSVFPGARHELLFRFAENEEIILPPWIEEASWEKAFGHEIRKVSYAGGILTDGASLFIPKTIEKLMLAGVKIKTFKNIDGAHLEEFIVEDSDLECGLLSLLKSTVKEVIFEEMDDRQLHKAARIINKYLKEENKSLIDCQTEMIDAGCDDYAKL